MAIIGVDIGGTNTDIGILENDGQILKSGAIKTKAKQGPESCMKRIASKTTLLMKQCNISLDDIAGIGVGCASPMDTSSGCMIHPPNFPKEWSEPFSIKNSLNELLNLPVEIDNDANAAALGELWVGQAKGISDFLLLTLGTGIGGGIVACGKVIRGSAGLGAELGHVGVYPGGETCGCGKKGCMEAYASSTGMIKMVKRFIESPDYQKGSSELENQKEIDAKLIFDLAREGDSLAIEIVKKAGEALGMGIGTLLNIFNPQKVILAGRMSQSYDILSPFVEESCRKHTFEAIFNGVTIETSSLGTDAGLIGAAAVFAYEKGFYHERKTMMKNKTPQSYTIAAINVGASGMRVAIVDISEDGRSYTIIKQEHIPGIQPNEEAIWDNMIKAYDDVLSQSSKKITDLKGFAVTSPGPIDRKRKQVLNTPNMNWSYVNVEEKLYRKINKPKNLEIPLYLERDAIGITLAEQYFGSGHDLKNFAVIYIGTGIGAGFVLNGKIFYGEHDHAGEFGHGIMDKDSTIQCRCLNFGCLECFASGLALINRCQYDIKRKGKQSTLSSKVNDLYYNDIRDAANDNDEVAINAFREFGKELGMGVSNLVNYLDLEKVIISGPLSRASQHYLSIVQEIAAQNIIFLEGDKEWSMKNIVATKLEDDAIEIAGCVAGFIEQYKKSKVRN